ncbi:carbon-nitrogen hydrolase family protein [Blastopirellula sp. JC732]|uniref:Carbon-nitrogen hydrolase family protein n=1 Tax=Blastopirellula sediminis TaxID=2894196 RepID=A0A9X1MQP3_9BACT|nr:carbon-nitrogen hydrolase family protein [Blastopirellula sediminis]MCC9605102.1 carbon-nitrogen hydrolase family protein [Blastopirellula sediminis]MCC9631598.1 carbon-nitrogen hydrolase family protein [Blastopirellula sediminis]
MRTVSPFALLLLFLNVSVGLAIDPWRTYSPRKELEPEFRVTSEGPEGQPGYVIEHDERDALDGAWMRTFPIKGGQHFRLSASAKLAGASYPRRQAYAEVWFTNDDEKVLIDDAKNQSRPYFAAETNTDDAGWTHFEGVFPAPPSATKAIVKLHLRWAPNSRIVWTPASLEPADPPQPRKVRLAAINFHPRGGKTTLDNCRQCEPYIAQAAEQKANLAVFGEILPELGTPLTFEEAAEPIPGPCTQLLGTYAKKYGLYLVTSMHEKADHKIYNTAVLIGPDGELVGKYRKVCLARDEYRKGVAPGDSFPVFDTPIGKIGMMICFDVHMPEVARGLCGNGAEIIAMPIMGGDPNLAKARCIENQVYLVTSTYSLTPDWMQSGVWNLAGEMIATATEKDSVTVAEVDLAQPYLWRANMGQFRTRLRHERPGNILPE